MTITAFNQTRGEAPAQPDAVSVALEAGVTNDRAQALIAASWALVEAYTGRCYWPVTAATAIAMVDRDAPLRWPRHPAPAALTVDSWRDGAWAAHEARGYVAELGAIEDLGEGRHRLAQVGTVDPGAPPPHVVEAVRALALYQLIHSAARREFRSIQAGDGTLTREALGGLFAASGAGVLLAGEVIW